MGKIWYGDVNNVDDYGRAIDNVFIDGRTKHGPWAIMNPTSFEMYGIGLGTGRGQKYVKGGVGVDGKITWSKVAG
jgi:hypothetical protein